jgi:hypothetical protein
MTLVDHTLTTAPAEQATVTESWIFRVDGSGSMEVAIATIHAINRAFVLAEQKQKNDFLDAVYLQFLGSGLATAEHTYRSEIIRGKIEYYHETLKFGWANSAFDVKAVITRKNFWEIEDGLVALPLSNTNGTDVTSGLNIFNSNDEASSSPTDRVNYADIDSADVVGDLPAPLKLEMTARATLTDIILAMCNFGDATAIDHMVEVEDSLGVTTGSDTTCSGASYGYLAFTDVVAKTVFSYVSSTNWSGLEAGRWYLPFLRLRTVPTIADLWSRIILSSGLSAYSQWVSYPASGGPQMIQYPPVQHGMPRLSTFDQSFQIQFKTSTTGTKTIYGDYIYLLPLDGVRFYDVTLTKAAVGDILVDDPYDDVVTVEYASVSSGKQMVRATGNPLLVDPREDARIYFVSPGSTAQVIDSVSMKAWYRPRRLAIL